MNALQTIAHRIKDSKYTKYVVTICVIVLVVGFLDENSIANDSLNARTVSLVINGTDTVTAVLSPDFTLGFVSAIPDYKISKKEIDQIKKNFYWDPIIRNESDYSVDVEE